MLFDFHDKLKSVSRGYASMDYELVGYRADDLVKLDMLVNGEPLDALSIIVHRTRPTRAGARSRRSSRRSSRGSSTRSPSRRRSARKIIARETVRAMRKDVTAKCYGGDISRKRKLLEKQKEGKKRMKQVGSVEIPQEAFLAILKVDEEPPASRHVVAARGPRGLRTSKRGAAATPWPWTAEDRPGHVRPGGPRRPRQQNQPLAS